MQRESTSDCQSNGSKIIFSDECPLRFWDKRVVQLTGLEVKIDILKPYTVLIESLQSNLRAHPKNAKESLLFLQPKCLRNGQN